jgi:hypothetical protein
MGLSRAFTQQSTPTSSVAANQYPNSSTVVDMTNLSTTPSIALTTRPLNNRRGFVVENDGTLPVIFANGSTVSLSARTALLFPNDVWEDLSGWQGQVTVAAVGSGAGAANITEMVYI